jgi:type III secretion system HrpE/YscL family protein
MTRVIRADRGGPAVIPAAVADAREQARAIVARAQAEAAALHARLLDEARVQARAELAAEHAALAQAHAGECAALERQAVELALLAARQIVGETLALAPERIVAIAAPLLTRLRRARRVVLRVHPDDAGTLELALAALRERTGMHGSLHIEGDIGVARGGCIASSDAGTLDARVETRIDALARALEAKPR